MYPSHTIVMTSIVHVWKRIKKSWGNRTFKMAEMERNGDLHHKITKENQYKHNSV